MMTLLTKQGCSLVDLGNKRGMVMALKTEILLILRYTTSFIHLFTLPRYYSRY